MTVTRRKVRRLLDEGYAVRGEFKLSSGRVSDRYIDCRAAMLEHPRVFRKFLESALDAYGWALPVATGTGGALMLATIGYGHLWNPKGHGQEWSPVPSEGADVVLFDDVKTTGATLERLRAACVEAGLNVVGEIVLYDRDDPAFTPVAYLASPYTSAVPGVPEARYDECVRAVARFQAQGLMVFSPIVHSHPPAVAHQLPTDFSYWEHMNQVFISRADELWVLGLDGWRESTGVRGEVGYAKKKGLPVFVVDPETLSQRPLLDDDLR